MNYTGRYIIKHPLLYLFRPKLILYTGKKSGKLKGKFKVFNIEKKLDVIKVKKDELLLQTTVSFMQIDILIFLYEEGHIKGFLDTPIGNINFRGVRMEE